MYQDEVREFCLSLGDVLEQDPFKDKNVIVYKHAERNKIFCIMDLSKEFINIKMLPEVTVTLRSMYDWVRPGWHMSDKTRWSSIYIFDGNDDMIRGMIRSSYDIVSAGSDKNYRNKIKEII